MSGGGCVCREAYWLRSKMCKRKRCGFFFFVPANWWGFIFFPPFLAHQWKIWIGEARYRGVKGRAKKQGEILNKKKFFCSALCFFFVIRRSKPTKKNVMIDGKIGETQIFKKKKNKTTMGAKK